MVPAAEDLVESGGSKVTAVLRRQNHLSLEITDQAPSSFITILLGAMIDVK